VRHLEELVKWTNQNADLNESLIPELYEEQIIVGSLAVNIVHAFTLLNQWVCGLLCFTIYGQCWRIFEVHSTEMGKPFM
jgi:hypothetical protein